jgi:DNA-binding NarL/FixJ family response regulator
MTTALGYAVDMRLRIEAAKARLRQALLAPHCPPGSVPSQDELVRDALRALSTVPAPDRRKVALENMAKSTANDDSPLTPQQALVVAHMASGLSSLQIAAKMHLSPHTVKQHQRAIKATTGLSGCGLVATAVREGWVS